MTKPTAVEQAKPTSQQIVEAQEFWRSKGYETWPPTWGAIYTAMVQYASTVKREVTNEEIEGKAKKCYIDQKDEWDKGGRQGFFMGYKQALRDHSTKSEWISKDEELPEIGQLFVWHIRNGLFWLYNFKGEWTFVGTTEKVPQSFMEAITHYRDIFIFPPK